MFLSILWFSLATIAQISAKTTRFARSWEEAQLELRQLQDTGSNSSANTEPFRWGNDTVRGVNLGGWLLSEAFIVPSVFKWNFSSYDPHVTDEWTLSRKFGQAGASDMLRSHWDTWITEDDFSQIKAAGLNTVRIPIGYWSVLPQDENDGYPHGAYDYLIQAVDVWAREAGIYVVVDLHGARGSQNGFDNSGQLGEARFFNSTADIAATLRALEVLAQEFGQEKYDTVVSAIAILNEPATFLSQPAVEVNWNYSRRAYDIVRAVNSETTVVIHDGFQPLPTYLDLYLEPEFHHVAIDTHSYSIFDPTTVTYANNLTALGELVCSRAANVSILNDRLWTLAGEWTAAITDCAPLVNSAQQAYSRWEQAGNNCTGYTGSLGLSESAVQRMRQYTEIQIREWEKAGQGWIFWTWKTEISEEWSMQAGIRLGIVPQPLDHFVYPDPCPSLATASIIKGNGTVYRDQPPLATFTPPTRREL